MWWRRRSNGRKTARGGRRISYEICPLPSGRFMAIEYRDGDIYQSTGRPRFHQAVAVCERWNQERRARHRLRPQGRQASEEVSA